MDNHLQNAALYKWKRQTPKNNSRTYSRSQNCKTSNDIKDWIKKVEQASDKATEVVLGTSHYAGRERGKYEALQTRQQVREQDQVISEAQQLLSEWMQEKLCVDDDTDTEADRDAAWHQTPVQAEVMQEWDRMVGNNDWEVKVTPRTKVNIPDTDMYGALDYSDEEEAVETILSHMMDKQVVDKALLQDSACGDQKKDPRLKMELRHKQVKENREKRQRELEKKRRELQEKKDSFHKAKQIVIKEEQSREIQMRKEEHAIRKEMVYIKKKMEAERKKQQELLEKELRQQEELTQAARKEELRQAEEAEKDVKRKQQLEEQRRRRQLTIHEKIQLKQSANKLKCLHGHFSAWYGIVLERRLQMGKARAMSDWKMLLRAWNAWRSYSRRCRQDLETRQYEALVVSMHRKQQTAETHHRCTLLRRYLTVWRSFVFSQQERRQLEEEHNNTRNKMMALLDAAATGKLWSASTDGETSREGARKEKSKVTEQELDDFFHQASSVVSCPSNGPLSSKSDCSLANRGSGRSSDSRVPTQAWQVTRKHVKLTNEEIASLTNGDQEENAQHSETKMRRRFGKQPWMNTHYIVNNFENRYTAQQKLLQEQQKQIKDQKRMIENLQFHQSQQNHLEDIACQQLIQKQLSKHGIASERETGATCCLNNFFSVSHTQGTLPAQQHNQVVKEKQTNVAIETARSDTSGQTTRTGVSSLHTGRTGSSTGTNKYLQVLKNMEERNMERKRLKAEREAKRKKEEEERLAVLEAQEAQLKQQVEEERRAQAAALREKRQLEKQREIQRTQHLLHVKEMVKQAEQHYIRSSLKYRGMLLFKKLVAISRNNQSKAEHHYNSHLLRQVIAAWHSHTTAVLADRFKVADEMNSFLAVKKCFTHWKLYKHHQRIEMEKAQQHYQRCLLHKTIQVWADVTSEEKCAGWEKERIAGEHYLWLLKMRSFSAWRSLPEKAKLAAEREKRRNEMRMKVAHILPDFEGFIKTSSEFL